MVLINLRSIASIDHLVANERTASPGYTTYYIDPQNGNDNNTGKTKAKAWKSFAPSNKLIFTASDKLVILSPGRFNNSLMLIAKGSVKEPFRVTFAPGKYDLYDTDAYTTKLHITNTNDVPDGLKAIAIGISSSKNIIIDGTGAKLLMHGKMIETFVDHSENVSITGLSYDYNTPTESECKVTELTDKYADLQVHKDSHYDIVDSNLFWKGDGWRYASSWYWQEFDPATSFVTRTGLNLAKGKFVDLGTQHIRVYLAGNLGLKKGFIYQTRDVTRDCAGFFLQRSKNISLRNIRIYYMHGMGVVSQYCENLSLDGVVVKPDEASGRTCAAWADILHFAGCRGKIEVKNSYLSAANDDALNVHGIHLRIMEQPAPNQIKVRFMHGQTYGFNAYAPGDSIELIHGNSLLAFGNNVVTGSQMLNDKEILLTLKKPITTALQKDDAVENITWTPSLNFHHNTITAIPTRGALVTTRRKVLIEHNKFIRTSSQAILVEDDAEGWFESGMVKDMTMRNNSFVDCGEPAISIHPENKIYNGPVHQNIRISGNIFLLRDGEALAAKSTKGISFKNNTIKRAKSDKRLISFENCFQVDTLTNKISIR
ncbi:right-handed parallel beta-helix repeat-containing protein [Mucilaginibacter myungsuensis]